MMVRFALWTLGIAVVGAVGAAATGNAMRRAQPQRSARPAVRRVATTAPKRDSVMQVAVAMPVIPQGSADTTHRAPHDTMVAQASVPTAAPAPASNDSAAPKPEQARVATVLPLGRTDLPDSVVAVRDGDTVRVRFDTSPLRTRRADKFERIVRETLPAVYGRLADTLLAAIPDGRLAAPNDLLTELPARGIHLAAADGRRIGLWPETRPGRDGPLVIAYRTLVER
jgi:hypothetical protein